jgi:hypothetical protein
MPLMLSPPGAENRRFIRAHFVSECDEHGVVRSAAGNEMLALKRNTRDVN